MVKKCQTITAYRGRRLGSPKGGFYVTDEVFARTYGKVTKSKVKICNPKKIQMSEWSNTFGNWDILTPQQKKIITDNFTKDGNDSIISEVKTPNGKIKFIWKDEKW